MDPMALSLALGTLSVFPFAVLLQPWFPKWARVLFVYVVCLAAGAEVAAASHRLHAPHSLTDAATIFGNVTAVLIASQAVYLGLSKTGILAAIEGATDLRRVPTVRLRPPIALGPNRLPQPAPVSLAAAAPLAADAPPDGAAPDQQATHPILAPVPTVVARSDGGVHIAPATTDSGSTPVTNPTPAP